MDMNLFRKHLATKQKTVNEAMTPAEQRADRALSNTNKHLDKAGESLDQALEALEQYLHNDSLSAEERRETKAALQKLERVQQALEDAADLVPLATKNY